MSPSTGFGVFSLEKLKRFLRRRMSTMLKYLSCLESRGHTCSIHQQLDRSLKFCTSNFSLAFIFLFMQSYCSDTICLLFPYSMTFLPSLCSTSHICHLRVIEKWIILDYRRAWKRLHRHLIILETPLEMPLR